MSQKAPRNSVATTWWRLCAAALGYGKSPAPFMSICTLCSGGWSGLRGNAWIGSIGPTARYGKVSFTR